MAPSTPSGTPAGVVTVLSGGMDSSTLAYLLADEGWRLHLLSFDYGQRHARELESAAQIAGHLRARHDVVDLRSVGALLGGSALTDQAVAVPDGHYSDESMRSTVVANRNAIFASVAVGVAVARSAQAIALGIHSGDHAIYPDCRPEFVAALGSLAMGANDGFIDEKFEVLTPLVHWTKASIVRRGAQIGLPCA
jgi:7-cyano-7-deazaguanine synthase